MKIKYNQAFTIVELVIVITILSILSVIWFVSYDWQIDSAKNTARITDISNLWTALKNHKLKSWWYPIPGDAFNIVYSWTTNIVAKQWYMNEKVYSTEIVTKPLDPEYKIPYIYSITTNRWYYQLRTTIFPEDDEQVEKAYLYWDYQTVAKTILPTLILATSTWAGNNIEIASGTTAGNINRLKFIVSNGTKNLAYNSEQIIPVSTRTTFDEIFRETWIEYPQFPWYSSCLEIYEAWRSIWSWSYQILDNNWAVTNTGCTMNY